MRVSVVVPVFEPGPGFDELLQSLDRQTLDARRFEVILCDDGSGPHTRDRLQRAARARSNVRVLTLPHTGWPGTPRNHGIDAARGDYVFFADQDDRLFEGGLQALCDFADRHSSDVVIGRVVGVGRRIPGQIFRRDIPRAVLGQDPILELLTPHKLFRSAFLREHGIRFPDGRVRLEDHLFVMQAYFHAGTISVLASTPCYAWLKNEGSASSSRIDPVTYFPHLETVLDLVEAHTEPGAVRDRLLRHWYRGKILKRLDARRMVRYPAAYRERFLDTVIPLAQARFGASVEDGLSFPLRVRSALLRAGRREDLLRLAQFESALECRAEVVSARWERSGRLRLEVEVEVGHAEEDALVFEARTAPGGSEGRDAAPSRGAKRSIWRPPASLGHDLLPERALDATRDLRSDGVALLVRDDTDDVERSAGQRRGRGSLRARAVLDPLSVFGPGDPSRGGPIVARVRHAGWTFDTALRADPAVLRDIGRSPVLAGRRCELTVLDDGTVAVRREWPGGRARESAARFVRRAASLARRILPPKAWRFLTDRVLSGGGSARVSGLPGG